MRKRLVYRCDDVGYTPAYDMGIFDVFDGNIGTAADIMFDACHAKEALEFVKERPWLSVGWHRHLWEAPVLSPEEVPSMVDEEGRFKWRHRKAYLMDEVTYEDAYKEFKAEMDLCYSVLGKYPDVTSIRGGGNELERAYKDVVEECGIVYNFFVNDPNNNKFRADRGGRAPGPQAIVDPKWEDRHIISADVQPDKGFKLEFLDDFEPLVKLTALKWTDAEEIYFYGCHPGFLDAHIYAESTSTLHRLKEYRDALSEEYKNWLISNKVELINFRDALYGTNEFQDHLKQIDSPLWIGNM
ncbi:MAG: ChbG/HpnK family deacetylase [Erysipelotrichaceae bacterium]|nr:ChbG/HpnK family deacetylase [Erysipelotrichaceae bacterium]